MAKEAIGEIPLLARSGLYEDVRSVAAGREVALSGIEIPRSYPPGSRAHQPRKSNVDRPKDVPLRTPGKDHSLAGGNHQGAYE